MTEVLKRPIESDFLSHVAYTRALEQYCDSLEIQEPVAWQVEVYINGGWSPMGNPQLNKSRAEALASNPSLPKEKQRIVPLYTHPPQRTWVGLTDEEFKQLIVELRDMPITLAFTIEAKLKEKNT